MKYDITYKGERLVSSTGYRWHPAVKGNGQGDMAATIINGRIERADHHLPIQAILEMMGDDVLVGSIPQDTGGDVQLA